MLAFRHILVPVDFSPCSTGALAYALALARDHRADVHVLFVDALFKHDREDRLRDRMARLIDDATAALFSPPPPIRQMVVRSIGIAPAIVAYAAEKNMNLIVMGTHGRGQVEQFFLGGVVRRVVRHTPCPVLTVREGTTAHPPDPETPIVVPVDFSEASRAALHEARDLAATSEAPLHVVHVIEDWLHPAFYGPTVQSVYDIDPDLNAKVERWMQTWTTPEREDEGHPFSQHVLPGRPSATLVQYAEEQNAGLIVMSSHGHADRSYVSLGSVTERVMERAACPVLILPAHAQPQPSLEQTAFEIALAV